MLIVITSSDTYSAESSKKLYEAAKCKKEIKILEGSKHGTDMLDSETMNLIVKWVSEGF